MQMGTNSPNRVRASVDERAHDRLPRTPGARRNLLQGLDFHRSTNELTTDSPEHPEPEETYCRDLTFIGHRSSVAGARQTLGLTPRFEFDASGSRRRTHGD